MRMISALLILQGGGEETRTAENPCQKISLLPVIQPVPAVYGQPVVNKP